MEDVEVKKHSHAHTLITIVFIFVVKEKIHSLQYGSLKGGLVLDKHANKLFRTNVPTRKPVLIHYIYHLPFSLPFLPLLPPSPTPLVFCAVGVDPPWHWSGDIKGSVVTFWWLWFPLGLPSGPPWLLA